MPSRPAVSTMTMSKCLALASARPDAATATGSPGLVSAESSADTPGCGAKTCTPARSAADLQRVDRARPLQVGRHQQRGMALSLKPLRELARQRRLSRTLQP